VTGPVSLDLFREQLGRGYGFHRNARRRLAEWIRAEPDERDPAAALPEFAGEAGAGESGRDVSHTVDLWATSNVFSLDHKLRLEVSSSNFPALRPQPEHGEEQARSTRMVKATNVIYHDKAHPSALILPIVP